MVLVRSTSATDTGITVGRCDECTPRIGRERAAAERGVTCEGTVDDLVERATVHFSEDNETCAREDGVIETEAWVLRGCPDESNRAFLHVEEERILLRLRPTVELPHPGPQGCSGASSLLPRQPIAWLLVAHLVHKKNRAQTAETRCVCCTLELFAESSHSCRAKKVRTQRSTHGKRSRLSVAHSRRPLHDR